MRRWLLVAAIVCAAPHRADAGRHVMVRGETLEHVARRYGCSTQALLRANRMRHVLVPAGRSVVVPACGRAASLTDDDRARRALAAIDGATPIAAPAAATPTGPSRSVGAPWAGALHGGARLPAGEGYQIRRPNAAYGAQHVVAHVRGAIAAVRALYPGVHTLAIGDLSAASGGPLGGHRSHQSGLDVDLGFYFARMPAGYPARFAAADAHLDLAATWALVTAFARTSHLPTGVQLMFLDRAVQERLYRWARARGTPDRQLAELLQYPRGTDVQTGLVRHWPNHADHLHVRFK